MSLFNAVSIKIAVGTMAAAVLAGGTAVSVNRHSASPTRQAAAGALSPVRAETGGETTFDAVVDPATGTVRLVTRAEAAGAGAAGGASAKGGAAGRGGRQPSSAAPATPAAPLPGTQASINAGVGGSPTAGIGSGGGTVQAPSGGSLGAGAGSSGGSGGSGSTPAGAPASGGNTPGGATPGGSVSISPGPAPTAPQTDVPPAPSSLAAHSDGSFTVVVPGSDRVSKQLCLSGTAANKCQTITVPALRPVELTVSFSGNAGTDKPTFTPSTCPGGTSVKVAALTPGATVTVTVNGKVLSATVRERGVQQTASLCDA